MKQHHPLEPHWFLPLIGVDPCCHRQGLGTALMQYGLVARDRDGKLAYLDSTKLSNIPFYERFGFELSSWKDRDWSPSASVSDAAAAALTCYPRPVCATFSESNGSRSSYSPGLFIAGHGVEVGGLLHLLASELVAATGGADPELPSRLIHCRVCKEPFAPTDGEYVLKYFLVDKAKKHNGIDLRMNHPPKGERRRRV